MYVAVTEGRDGPTAAARKRYSSCGDLGNWLLQRLGVAPRLLNRTPHYRVGWNIAMLASPPLSEVCPKGPPLPGDVCIIKSRPASNDDHVCVALAGGVAGMLRTANYGAGGMSESVLVGARIVTPPLAWQPHVSIWRVGAKSLYRIVRIESAMRLAVAAPDLTGAELPGEVLDAIEALWR